MKEWKLRLLILFSLSSILGLMLIQAYWIRDAIDIKESHFRQTVNQAVTNAVWSLENLALTREEKLRKRVLNERRTQIDTLAALHLDGSTMISDNGSGTIAQPTRGNSGSLKRVGSIDDSMPDWSDSLPEGRKGNVKQSYPFDQDMLLISAISDSILDQVNRSIDQHYADEGIRTYLETLLDQVSARDKGHRVTELLDSALLAIMIREELEKEGIRLGFVFGVYFPFTEKMVFCDSVGYWDQLKKSELVYSLFPNFRLSKPAYLMLHFPGEKKYLFSRLGWVLSLSMILMLILIWSFYFITRNTYRQKKLGEMKNDFINNMTHEFKTPVSTISLACEALRDQELKKTETMVESYLQIINEENRRLGKLAEQILQTAVIDKGHLYLTFEPVDLHDLIGQIIEKYRQVVEQRSGKIGTKFLAANTVISGDRTHLYNMISNLVDNAIKYSGERTEIEILTTDTLHQFTISIQDRGIGISKSNQKRIFDKLYRVPTGNVHNAKGFGLGLSYVKYVVMRHEGSVHVESELQKGSRFIVVLPRQPMNKQQTSS